MASIRKLKSGNYQVQIRLTGLPPVAKTFSKKKDALSFVKQVEGDTELHRKLGKAHSFIPTFQSLVDLYMSQYNGRDKGTAGKLDWWCKRFGCYSVIKIDEFMVDDGLVDLKDSGLTGSTINRYKSTLSAVFIFFIQHKNFKRAGFTNPVRKESVTRFKENPAKDRFLTDKEQKALLQAATLSHWNKLYLLVLLALTTGARKGELLNLKWSDIDFQQRVATLNRQDTKNKKARLLPLSNHVIKELMKFREHTNFLIFHSTVSMSTPFDIKNVVVK